MAAYDALANINMEQNGDSSNSDHATPPTIVINLNNNTGNVVIGDNNNVTIEHICAPSCGAGLDRCCADASVSNDITTENLTYIRKPFNSDTDFQLSRRTPLPIEERLARDESSQQLRADFKREKRKEHSLFHEASDFLTRKKNDRKRAKRGKRDSRFSTSSSDEESSNVSTFNELTPESESDVNLKQGLRLFNYYSKRLHPLRDNGQWTDFDCVAQKLLDQAGGNLTCQIIISLEKSLPLSYQNRLEESENLLNEAVEKIAQTRGSVRPLLEMVSKCYLAAIYRRRKMLGKTVECLHEAKKISSRFPPCLAIAILLYEEGSYKRDFAAMLSGVQKKNAIGEAKEFMQSCADLCCGLDGEDVYARKQHFAVSKIAIMSLQCETSGSRKEKIPTTNVKQALQSMQTLRSDCYCKKEVKTAKIQRLKVEVDMYYRIENFPEAEKRALEALELVDTLECYLERKPFQDRLEDIRRTMTASSKSSSSEKYRETPKPAGSSSDSPSSRNDSPHSSETEHEEF